jgi:hypothetical protein
MSAAPLLAALLVRAMPGLAARDLGLPLGALLPWLPGARAGIADAAALDPAERALFGRFRQHGRGLLGLDPVADAEPDPASEAARDRLAWMSLAAPVPGATVTLVAGGTGEAPLPEGFGRIILVAGRDDAPERNDMLLPEARLGDTLDRLCAAAAALAGPGWRPGGRSLSRREASLSLLVPRPGHVPDLLLPAAALPHDLAVAGGPEGLPLDGTRQVRLLIGSLPPRRWRLSLRFTGAEPGPAALFLDGLRIPARPVPGGLVAGIDPPVRHAPVLGLAWRDGAPPGLRLVTLEARP